MALAVGGVVALLGASVGYIAFHDLAANPSVSQRHPNSVEAPADPSTVHAPAPQYPSLAVGETLEWTANDNPVPVFRSAGPYLLEVTRRDEDEMAAAILKLSAAGQSVTFEGELAQPGLPNKISLISNRAGAVPVVMLQSFSGGAHCCNHVQLAGYSNGHLKVVDLGSWDGDEINVPKDISGDGTTDFIIPDNRFLYAFASYAESYAPPRIFNVVGGRVVDVSKNPKFRSLYAAEMAKAGALCQPGNGSGANGACPSLVAAAARLGRLDQAWRQMLGAYDPTVDWTFPTGCWVADDNGCPAGQEITYKSYPEALQAFLVRGGYIPPNWIPPERRELTQPDNQVPVTPTT